MMSKNKVGSIFAYVSLLMVIVNCIIFFIVRGPNANMSIFITVFSIFSILGIIYAIISLIVTRKSILISSIGLVANIAFIIICYLLLIAMGISST